MASNHSGKIIKDIKILKSKVVITFQNSEKLEISNETYTYFYFYVGKKISLSELKEIKKTDEVNKYLKYAIKTATSSLMTESKLISKLYDRGASKIAVSAIMKILKDNDIINDLGYIQDYIEYGNEALYGEKKIKDNLIKKGISVENVNKINFSKTNELKKAKALLKKYEQSLTKYSYVIRKRKIYNHLLSQGYQSEIALEALQGLKKDKNDKLIDEELNKAMKAWLRANEHKYDSSNDKFKNLCAYLQRKGYSYSKIRKTWSENYEFND